MNNKNKQEKIYIFKEMPSEKGKEKAKKDRLAQWFIQEIASREYTQKEIDAMIYLVKQGKQEEA
jgi:hypothetical protein